MSGPWNPYDGVEWSGSLYGMGRVRCFTGSKGLEPNLPPSQVTFLTTRPESLLFMLSLFGSMAVPFFVAQ